MRSGSDPGCGSGSGLGPGCGLGIGGVIDVVTERNVISLSGSLDIGCTHEGTRIVNPQVIVAKSLLLLIDRGRSLRAVGHWPAKPSYIEHCGFSTPSLCVLSARAPDRGESVFGSDRRASGILCSALLPVPHLR